MSKKNFAYQNLFSGDGKDIILYRRFIAYSKTAISRYRSSYLEKKIALQENIVSNEILEEILATHLDDDLYLYLPFIQQLENNCLIQSILRLSPSEQRIIEYYIYHKWTFKEISRMMNLSLEKTRSIYYHAIKKLRKWMGGEAP